LRDIAQTVLRLGKAAGAEETEVHLDETLDALTRFANNGIHQNVAEHGLTISVRTVLDGKTARVSTNKLDHDSLRTAVESSLSLAASQPRTPHLSAMPGKQHYKRVRRYVRATADLSAEDRARAVRKACDLAVNEGQVAAGIFVSGQVQSAIANSRGLFATHRQTRGEFSITMQQDPAASWAKGNAADVRDLDPIALAKRASAKAKLAATYATKRNVMSANQAVREANRLNNAPSYTASAICASVHPTSRRPCTCSSVMRYACRVSVPTNSSSRRSAGDTGGRSRSPSRSALATSLNCSPCNCRNQVWLLSQ